MVNSEILDTQKRKEKTAKYCQSVPPLLDYA